MNRNLEDYLSTGEYLPQEIRDFHDQKTLFKRLNEIVQNRQDGYVDNINWISAQVYTIDVFLWFMATHGYKLQKIKKDLDFYNLGNELYNYEQKRRESKANMIKQFLNKSK